MRRSTGNDSPCQRVKCVHLNTTTIAQQDRTWTNPEFGKLIGRAMAEEREDYILALYLARYAGLRIHECFRMDTAAAERALRENALTVKGKGGKVRIVPIEDDRIIMMLQRLLDKTERGHKLLVPDGVPTDRAINAMQQFILRHRDAICDPTAPDRRITLRGKRRKSFMPRKPSKPKTARPIASFRHRSWC